MKKSILSIGQALTRAEQQTIHGGLDLGGSRYRCNNPRIPQRSCDKHCRYLEQKSRCKELSEQCHVTCRREDLL